MRPVRSALAGLFSSVNLILAIFQTNSNATIRDSNCDLKIWFSFTFEINVSSDIPSRLSKWF